MFSTFNNIDLSQITIEVYEQDKGMMDKNHEFVVRVGFSPGAVSSNLISLEMDKNHALAVAPRRWITEYISIEKTLECIKTNLPK